MKLIIDISEERYKKVCKEQWLPNRLYFERAIANGTPLDDVKAEIEGLRFGQPLRKFVVDECLSIIDKYIGKAESEGKTNEPTSET